VSRHPYPFDPDTGIPGALNRGQAVGSALGNTLKFWSYLCTVFGAVVAGTEETFLNFDDKD
jgi:hypothetical protein